MARWWHGYDRFLSSEQWVVSDEIWHKNKRFKSKKHVLLLRRICYSLFLSIRVCDPTIENMSFCSSVQSKTHYSQLIARCSPLTVKHFYFCPQTAFWCQNEQKSLKIVQKQTWKVALYCPTAKFWLSNWEKIIFQLGNNIFPTGHFRHFNWFCTKIRYCKIILSTMRKDKCYLGTNEIQ